MDKKDRGVRRVVQYAARDGSLHATYAAATSYNSQHALEMWLDAWLCDNQAHGELIGTAAELAEALRAEWNISKRKEK